MKKKIISLIFVVAFLYGCDTKPRQQNEVVVGHSPVNTDTPKEIIGETVDLPKTQKTQPAQPITQGDVIYVNEKNFKLEVEDFTGLVLADFSAAWCVPCRKMEPIIKELAKTDKIKVISIDIDQSPNLAQRFNINTIPCFIVFSNGEVNDRHIGEMDFDIITKWISQKSQK